VETTELEKGVRITLAKSIAYVPDAITSQILLKKITGTVKLFALDKGKTWAEKIAPFDTLLHVIEGSANLIINSQTTEIAAGEAIIIPAHTRNSLVATHRLKMITTLIKSGYEEIT
jgi:quercetin dioxygenase-like cupin family protein